ncbi:hypothetical protein MVEG_08791 [Podila verticillata NRRL 6337]|nr:hypothetical protein MVEG_08791 [Podila verticillata NRRL 6337]
MLVSDTDLVYAAGDNKMGQLGNKTNSQYLQQSNRLVHILQTNPVHMALLKYKVIIQVACSANKTLALDTEGMVFSWGFGGYMTIAVGSLFSMALDGQNQLWLWDKWKTTGDGGGGMPWMCPRTLYDLNGWSLMAIADGNVALWGSRRLSRA